MPQTPKHFNPIICVSQMVKIKKYIYIYRYILCEMWDVYVMRVGKWLDPIWLSRLMYFKVYFRLLDSILWSRRYYVTNKILQVGRQFTFCSLYFLFHFLLNFFSIIHAYNIELIFNTVYCSHPQNHYTINYFVSVPMSPYNQLYMLKS